MTAPRMISAEEARTLTEAATPGPWAVDERVACVGIVAPALTRLPGLGRDYPGVIAFWHPPIGVALDECYPRWSHDRPGDLALLAAAPDLAATVVTLHAEVERVRSDDYAQARRIADAAIAAERARIVALLRERADATREHDGRESVVSASYRLAASLIVAKVTP